MSGSRTPSSSKYEQYKAASDLNSTWLATDSGPILWTNCYMACHRFWMNCYSFFDVTGIIQIRLDLDHKKSAANGTLICRRQWWIWFFKIQFVYLRWDGNTTPESFLQMQPENLQLESGNIRVRPRYISCESQAVFYFRRNMLLPNNSFQTQIAEKNPARAEFSRIRLVVSLSRVSDSSLIMCITIIMLTNVHSMIMFIMSML